MTNNYHVDYKKGEKAIWKITAYIIKLDLLGLIMGDFELARKYYVYTF